MSIEKDPDGNPMQSCGRENQQGKDSSAMITPGHLPPVTFVKFTAHAASPAKPRRTASIHRGILPLASNGVVTVFDRLLFMSWFLSLRCVNLLATRHAHFVSGDFDSGFHTLACAAVLAMAPMRCPSFGVATFDLCLPAPAPVAGK